MTYISDPQQTAEAIKQMASLFQSLGEFVFPDDPSEVPPRQSDPQPQTDGEKIAEAINRLANSVDDYRTMCEPLIAVSIKAQEAALESIENRDLINRLTWQ